MKIYQGSIVYGEKFKIISIYTLSKEKFEEMKHACMLHASYHYCCEKDFPL